MSINVTQLAAELGAYSRTQNKEIRKHLYLKSKTTSFMKMIASVKGRFPALQSITTHVVQGFESIWNELGVTTFKVNELVNYQQKVNYGIVPADILASWAAFLYQEDKKPADMPISKYIMDELMLRVQADREILVNRGVLGATAAERRVFGKSMNGLVAIINAGFISTTNPIYQVPMVAVTTANVVDQVNDFELALPEQVKESLKKIYLSQSNVEKYALNFFKTYGIYPTYTPEGGLKTIIGSRQLIGLPGLNGSDLIFTTPDDNFLHLHDINTDPVVTDVQTLDYKVKIFMEWWEGVAFWSNQLVIAGNIGGNTTGLAVDNELYYDTPAIIRLA